MPNVLISAERVAELKQKLHGVYCKNACNGTGVIITYTDKGITFNDCACVKEFKWEYKLLTSNIPVKYWDFTLRNLLKVFIEENNQALAVIDGYVSQIELMLKEGVGLYIEGMHGLAKTALSCYIAKQFLRSDKIVYFMRMSGLTNLVFESIHDDAAKEKLTWIRKNVQLLVIDEIEKDYKIDNESTFSGSHISEIFDDIYETKKCLIVTSNLTKDKLKTHSLSVLDRLSELVDIPLVGDKSYRGIDDKKKIILKGIKK